MPILHVSIGELLQITGTVPATLRSDRIRKHACAAFGTEHPVLESRVLLADGIAWGVRDELSRHGLSRGLNRRAAANIARAFWPEWAEALSRVEHQRQPFIFSVAEREDGAWWCGCGRADKLADFVASQPPLKRLFCVNVAQIMVDMQARAKKARLDLSTGSFILPPDDPTFVQWLAEFRAQRDAVLKRYDPLHAKPPPALSAAQRRAIWGMSCALN